MDRWAFEHCLHRRLTSYTCLRRFSETYESWILSRPPPPAQVILSRKARAFSFGVRVAVRDARPALAQGHSLAYSSLQIKINDTRILGIRPAFRNASLLHPVDQTLAGLQVHRHYERFVIV